jgi:predicted enzyme related to lactoylglutathione lyase
MCSSEQLTWQPNESLVSKQIPGCSRAITQKPAMKIVEIAFSVYPVTDLKRARAFYEGTLGLKPATVYEGDGTGWVEYEIGPSVLAIGAGSEQFKPSAYGGSVALEVEDFAAATRELKEYGSKFVIEPMEFPACHMAAVLDPDGNTITIHKRKATNP